MSLPDLPLDELRRYQNRQSRPVDAPEFWAGTLAGAARYPVAATFEPADSGLRLVDTFDVCFAGYGGHPFRGWLHLPAGQFQSQAQLDLGIAVREFDEDRGKALGAESHKVVQSDGLLRRHALSVPNAATPSTPSSPSSCGFRGRDAPSRVLQRIGLVDLDLDLAREHDIEQILAIASRSARLAA